MSSIDTLFGIVCLDSESSSAVNGEQNVSASQSKELVNGGRGKSSRGRRPYKFKSVARYNQSRQDLSLQVNMSFKD